MNAFSLICFGIASLLIGFAIGRTTAPVDTGYRAGESAAYTAAFATLDNQAAKITQLERLLEECRVKQGHRTAERP